MLLRLRDDMQALQQTYLSSSAPQQSPHELVRVLTDAAEISALSAEICLSAREDVMSLETGIFTRPPDPRSSRVAPADVVARGVRFRNIYAPAALDVAGAREMLRRSSRSDGSAACIRTSR